MPDLPAVRQRDVLDIPEPDSVKKKRLQVEIQNTKSRIAATKRSILEVTQQIEDLKQGKLVDLEASVEMLELRLEEYEGMLKAFQVK